MSLYCQVVIRHTNVTHDNYSTKKRKKGDILEQSYYIFTELNLYYFEVDCN